MTRSILGRALIASSIVGYSSIAAAEDGYLQSDAGQYINTGYHVNPVSYCDDFHGQFVIIENSKLHNFGSSMNCLGRRVTTYATRDTKEIRKILGLLP